METDKNRYLITFKITSMSFKFENYCNRKDLDVKMVPVPSKLSNSCGYACRIKKEDIEEIKKLCDEKNIKYGEIYRVDKEGIPHKIGEN